MSPLLRALLLVLPSIALAQSSGVGGKTAAPLNEIEHGLYIRGEGGPFFWTKAPASSGPQPFSSGQMVQMEFGYEFNEWVSAGVFGMFTSNTVGADYIGKSGGAASGDFSSIIPGAVVRLNGVGLSDENGVKRAWLYLRAGVGYVKFFPTALLPDADALVFAGPGIEYNTHLRHFAIGLEVSGAYLLSGKVFGFSVTPSIRYAF